MVEATQPTSCMVAPNSTEQSFLLLIVLYRCFIDVASVDTLTVLPEAVRFKMTICHLTGSAVNRYLTLKLELTPGLLAPQYVDIYAPNYSVRWNNSVEKGGKGRQCLHQ